MSCFTGPVVLLLVILCGLSVQEEKVILEVRYPQRTIYPARGSSVKLSCDAHYDFKRCGLLHAVWYNLTEKYFELADPSKYFTTVNETVSDDNMRRRQIVTEILNLTPEDDGQFQCRAECTSGHTSEGHFIYITVEG